ncbi:MAG: DMT family transporter [Alphaproteobacteria bacterium]
MTPLVVILVLMAALLHATWNALLKGGSDRLWMITVMAVVGALGALPLALILPKPEPASWVYLAASAGLQVIYCLVLVRAYRDGALTHVYPIARGIAPLLVTVGAAIFAAERLDALALAGITLVSSGILLLALDKERPDAKSTAAALTAGAFIASYMVIDGVGVRVSHHAIGYAAWQAVAQGVGLPLLFTALRRRPPPIPRGRPGLPVIIAALIGAFGYGVVIWAMSLAPMGQVSALRETSILFAAAIGAVFLREAVTPRRVVAAAIIVTGAVVLAAS